MARVLLALVFIIGFFSFVDSRMLVRCHKQNFICKMGQPLCNVIISGGAAHCPNSRGNKCYDAGTQECLKEGVICNKGQKACLSKISKIFDILAKHTHIKHSLSKAVGEVPKCYDPKTQSCHSNGKVCGANEKLCNGNCYDPRKQNCIIGSSTVCPIGKKACGNTCYSPGTHYCARRGSHKICKRGESLCGHICYKRTSTTKCHYNNYGHAKICKAGLKYCNGVGCYDPKKNLCFHRVAGNVVCNKGQYPCGKRCYSFKDSRCHVDRLTKTWVPCKHGHQLCGTRCYNRNTHICDKRIVCKRGHKRCGRSCYNPTTATCIQQEGFWPLACKHDHDACGTKCYDFEKHECFHHTQNGIPGTVLCKIGEENCGSRCFNPDQYFCHKSRVCKIGQKPCGDHSCYDPRVSSCFKYKGFNGKNRYTICRKGYRSCGSRCYKPDRTSTCTGKFGQWALCKKGTVLSGTQCVPKAVHNWCNKHYNLEARFRAAWINDKEEVEKLNKDNTKNNKLLAKGVFTENGRQCKYEFNRLFVTFWRTRCIKTNPCKYLRCSMNRKLGFHHSFGHVHKVCV